MSALTQTRDADVVPSSPLRSDAHRWTSVLAFGFNVDPLGHRRRPVWRSDPACLRYGRKVDLDPEAVSAGVERDHGWRPDATWRLIQLLAAVRLISDLKPVRTRVYFADKQCTPNPSLVVTHRRWHIAERPQADLTHVRRRRGTQSPAA